MEGQGLNAEGKVYFHQIIIDSVAYQVLGKENERQEAFESFIKTLDPKEHAENIKALKK